MIMTEDSHSIRRNIRHYATLFAPDSMCNGLELNWVFLCERLATDYMSIDMAWTRHDLAFLYQIFCIFINPQFCWRWKQEWLLNCFLRWYVTYVMVRWHCMFLSLSVRWLQTVDIERAAELSQGHNRWEVITMLNVAYLLHCSNTVFKNNP
jgi:hypothetical protein